MLNNQTPVIFTDLDGTLLDHEDYSFAAAESMLVRLAANQINVIPNTSKTRAEVMVLREKMNLTGPFIVENGAAVYLPINFFPELPEGIEESGDYLRFAFASPRAKWLDLLQSVTPKFSGLFRHFATMTVDQICESTGLNYAEAQLAQQREFGEPIEWLGNIEQKKRFIQALTDLGANPVEGGRFIHLKDECDKAHAMNWLMKQLIHQEQSKHWVSIALGDGQNDVAMLEEADYAVLIASPVNPLPQIKTRKNVITSKFTGPAGWSECLEILIF
jgi:mannosyl-3-phosphoglycerate phosphatase family protein